MKIFIPKNIDPGMFNMKLSVGPLNVTMVQLFIMALGLALCLMIWNGLASNGVSKAIAVILILPVFLIFVVIAFFRYSELSLIPFIAKLIRTYFLDETTKFQTNYKRIDPIDVLIKRQRSGEQKQLHTVKGYKVEKEKLEDYDRIF